MQTVTKICWYTNVRCPVSYMNDCTDEKLSPISLEWSVTSNLTDGYYRQYIINLDFTFTCNYNILLGINKVPTNIKLIWAKINYQIWIHRVPHGEWCSKYFRGINPILELKICFSTFSNMIYLFKVMAVLNLFRLYPKYINFVSLNRIPCILLHI